MIISAPTDYRLAAERRLPRFLFDYIDGGAVTERTMKQNVEELATINLRQRVLTGAGTPSLETEIMGQKWAMPIALVIKATSSTSTIPVAPTSPSASTKSSSE